MAIIERHGMGPSSSYRAKSYDVGHEDDPAQSFAPTRKKHVVVPVMDETDQSKRAVPAAWTLWCKPSAPAVRDHAGYKAAVSCSTCRGHIEADKAAR